MPLPTEHMELNVIDSHTGGEPTRLIVGGAPTLRGDSIQEQLDDLRANYDWIRTALVTEPRGYEAMVGGILLPPGSADAVARVLYFDNGGYLGMCGHGTIGLAASLAYLGKISPGNHLLETIAGPVVFDLHEDNRVSFDNVLSYCIAQSVPVPTKSFGTVTGDIAYGGNWFFLCDDHGLELDLKHIRQLTACCEEIKQALHAANITGEGGTAIRHVELMGPGQRPDADARNFVHCPGGEYDRSPCGTGTSAKLACLAARGKLDPEVRFGQESIRGSLFEGRYTWQGNKILPRITGEAFVMAETRVVLDPNDPLTFGSARRATDSDIQPTQVQH